MITPPLNEDYWILRVKLHDDQAVVAFPKFHTIGIGFAIEDVDWNSNLPHFKPAHVIAKHIFHNHKYDSITKEMTVEAIEKIQDTIKNLGWDRNETENP